MIASRSWKRTTPTLIAYVVVAFAVVVFVFPVYWMLATSLKTRWDAFAIPPRWIFEPTLENYFAVLTGSGWSPTPMSELLGHSLGFSLGASALALVAGTLTGYSLARFRVRGASQFASWVLSTRVFPPVVVALPVFTMMQALELVDTYPGLVIPYAAASIPFAVWMLKGFFEGIPVDMEEAAMVDGCSRFDAFRRITLRLAAPGLASTALFVWILSWNEFILALLMTRSLKTAPVAVTEFVTLYGIEWGQLTATAAMMALPPLILTLFLQRHLVEGLTFGAVK